MKSRRSIDAIAIEQRHRRHAIFRAHRNQSFGQRGAFEKTESGSGVEFYIHKLWACHSERSEESLLYPYSFGLIGIPRYARNDRTKSINQNSPPQTISPNLNLDRRATASARPDRHEFPSPTHRASRIARSTIRRFCAMDRQRL